MPVLVLQQGHCYRTKGATGTAGEQGYATAVANACVRLLNGKGGWVVNPTLADENDYRGDAFVAVHCDGSTNPSARGASVGYRTPEGQAFGQAWKRAYAARGWPGGFRPDNYTAALSGYYGTGYAVAAGNRRAAILECGFRTNPDDRAALDAPGGADRVALAIGDALGIPFTSPGGFLMALSDAEQRDLYNRVFGMLRQRWYATVDGETVEVGATHAGARPATVLDSLDGNYIVRRLGDVSGELDAARAQIEQATEAATTAASAALMAASKAEQAATGGVDLDAFVAAVADELDRRARDNDPTTGPRS